MDRFRRPLAGPVLAVALAAAASCNRTPEQRDPFDVRLVLDQGVGSFCDSASCEDYGMSCGAVVMIGMTDLESGATVVDECDRNVPPSESICGLKDIDQTTFFNIPATRMRISVAVWRPGLLPDDACPGDEIFDRQGVPRADFSPRPAFGGSVFFDAGSSAGEVVVPLSCTDAHQLNADECTAGDIQQVHAQIDDIWTLLDLTAERAVQLNVRAAAPRQVPVSKGVEYIIEQSGSVELDLEDGPVPSFSADVMEPLGETVCAVVRDDSAPQSTSVASCGEFAADANPLELRGVLLDNETLDRILAAIGSEFPDQGLVVGRVVDHDGAPLEGVSLDPGGAELGVEYLDADMTAIGGTMTSTSGFFISRSAPFGSVWAAEHLLDGRRQEGEPRAGLIRGKVTAVIVRMQAP